MIEVSVIVPVFNIGQYLEKCIKSLINQSIFDNMEIILVNDGSTIKALIFVMHIQESMKT